LQLEECLEGLGLQVVLELWFSEEEEGYIANTYTWYFFIHKSFWRLLSQHNMSFWILLSQYIKFVYSA
jgi:hypothetical protein